MKVKSLPINLFVEVLDYLADYEQLTGLDHVLNEDYNIVDVRSALREMANHFRLSLEEEKKEMSLLDFRKDDRISQKARDILSALSPTDERRLLKRFGFLDL